METDYYQIKLHLNQAGTITCDNLADPASTGDGPLWYVLCKDHPIQDPMWSQP